MKRWQANPHHREAEHAEEADSFRRRVFHSFAVPVNVRPEPGSAGIVAGESQFNRKRRQGYRRSQEAATE